MISTISLYISVIVVFLAICKDVLPTWFSIVMTVTVIVTHIVSYVSEENLRNTVRELKNKIETEERE